VHRIDRFATAVPVGARVEGVRSAAGGCEAGDRVANHGGRDEHHIHAGAQRRVALEALQRAHTGVLRDEGR
jgi:hypothetical protein